MHTFFQLRNIVITWLTRLIVLGKVSVVRTTHHKAHHIDTPDDGFLSSCLQKYYILPTSVVVHPPAETAAWIRTSQSGRNQTALLLH